MQTNSTYLYKKPIIVVDNTISKLNRRVFKFETGIFTNYKIKAGGILFYKIVNNKPEFLLIEENEFISDFGGKTELYDDTIYDTIAREVNEETNSLFDKEIILKILYDNNKFFYVYRSKYLLFLIDYNKYSHKLSNINGKEFFWTDTLDSIHKLNPRILAIKIKILQFINKIIENNYLKNVFIF